MMDQKKIDRIKDRREQGLTYRELGDEFGISHTHARRMANYKKEIKVTPFIKQRIGDY